MKPNETQYIGRVYFYTTRLRGRNLSSASLKTLPTDREEGVFRHFELGEEPLRLHVDLLVVSKQRLVHVLQLHGTRTHL